MSKDSLRITSVFGIGHAEDSNPRFRKQMEDVCVMIDKFGNSPNTGFFAIYDGHGGTEAARIAGDNLHRYLLEELISNKKTFILENPVDTPVEGTPSELGQMTEKAVKRTDELMKQRNIQYTGCTACICIVTLKRFDFIGVGDSRAVLSIDGKALRCTVDHKATDKSEMERVKAAGGAVIYGRVNGFISVSRALGDHCIKSLVISDPYLRTYERTPSDEFMVICCDGIWDVISDQQAIDIIRKSLKETGSPQKAAFELKNASIRAGTQDNVSVLVLVLKDPGSFA